MCVCTSAEVLKVAVSFFAVTNWLPEVATGPWQHFATIFSRLPSFPLNEAEKENWTLHRPATTCQFLLLDQEEKVPNIRFGHQCKLCFIGLDQLPCWKIINGSVFKPFSAKSIIISSKVFLLATTLSSSCPLKVFVERIAHPFHRTYLTLFSDQLRNNDIRRFLAYLGWMTVGC